MPGQDPTKARKGDSPEQPPAHARSAPAPQQPPARGVGGWSMPARLRPPLQLQLLHWGDPLKGWVLEGSLHLHRAWMSSTGGSRGTEVLVHDYLSHQARSTSNVTCCPA